MSDISEINSSETVKVVGSDSSGQEQTPVQSNENGKLMSANVVNDNGVEGTITVGTSAIELKVGGSVLANRIFARVHNSSNATIYWGYTSGVTTANGQPIEKNNWGEWDVGPAQSIYLIAGSAGNVIRAVEGA